MKVKSKLDELKIQADKMKIQKKVKNELLDLKDTIDKEFKEFQQKLKELTAN